MNEARKAFPEICVTEAELVRWMEMHQGVVAEALKQPHQSWHPQLMVMTKHAPADEWKANIYVLAVPFNEAGDKRLAMRRIGQDLYQKELIPGIATMSTEAWRSKTPGVEPRLAADREEVVSVQGRTFLEQRTGWTSMPVSRDANDMIVPSVFGPIITEGVHTKLLDHLFSGFAEAGLAAIQRKRQRRQPSQN